MKPRVFDVEFAAKISVCALSASDAVELAHELLDRDFCYATYVHAAADYASNTPLDLQELALAEKADQ